jgi:DnaJ-domain-containing protein 1
MSRLSDGPFGKEGKKLSELSEQELREVAALRRGERIAEEPPPALDRIRQYLANLELSPSATWPEVERAYRRLRDRYSPEKHEGHPERHETALELSESLSKAYQTLRKHFGR